MPEKYLKLWLTLCLGLVFILAACGDDDETDNNNTGNNGEAAVSNPTTIPATPDEEVVSPVPTTPAPTAAIVPPTDTSTPTIEPTATYAYPFLNYAGEWSYYIQVSVSNTIFADEFRYTGNALIFVDYDESITGSGRLSPTVFDDECNIQHLYPTPTPQPTSTVEAEPQDEDAQIDLPYQFDIIGNLRYDGTVVWMDIEIIPDNYQIIENYRQSCREINQSGEFSVQLLWLSMGETGRLSYQIPVPENTPQFTVNITEDMTERTGGQLEGFLEVDMIITRR